MAQIRHSITIDASQEKVYPLVSTAKGFSKWWAADATEKGGIVELGFFKRATVYQLELTKNVPPNEVEWACLSGQEWKGTRIRFSMSSGSGKTIVKFTHADWKAETDYFVSCTTTWGELMFRLKGVAEGKSPGPLFSADGLAY
ncbi:MAG TPA: SRPBCC domain-containing protein [Candidatus Acidoferrales bacterium]|nr:SRPBCC domain-containing protein [Candidatus Acidoferrales bacterium]